MSDTIVLRKVFALDSNTGLFIPPGSVLLTNGLGGTYWSPLISSLSLVGGPVIGDLPSTVNILFTLTNYNTSTINEVSTTINNNISNLSTNIDIYNTINNTYLQGQICSIQDQVNSQSATIYTEGLGSVGYVSSLSLYSTVYGLGTAGYISTATLNTVVSELGSSGFVSTATLYSTIYGLGSAGYISSINSYSNTMAIANMGFVSTPQLFSTVYGLGQIYISSINSPISFNSTVYGLGTAGYVSSASLRSTIYGLGTAGYVSSASLTSTVSGLSTFGYVNNLQLYSTTYALSNLKTNIRFDNVTTVVVNGGINNFSAIDNLIYRSTFYQSSIAYSGAAVGTQIAGNLTNPSMGENSNLLDMEFSTFSMKLDVFSSFIISGTSQITFDIYPTLAFTKLATGASNLAFLPISTMLKYGSTILLNETTVTNYLYAGNTQIVTENSAGTIDASNIFNQPIRLIIPNTRTINYNEEYSLYHYMPSSINNGEYQNALHSNLVTPYFGTIGSVFITVMNSL